MSSLYAMSAEMASLVDQLMEADDDGQREAFEKMLAESEEEIEAKVERIALWMLELNARSEVKAQIAKQYSDAARVASNHAQRLKDYLTLCLTNAGMQKVKTEKINVTLGKGPDKVVIDEQLDLAMVPERFLRISTDIDKSAVKDALRAGETVPWARLDGSTSLRVKP